MRMMETQWQQLAPAGVGLPTAGLAYFWQAIP